LRQKITKDYERDKKYYEKYSSNEVSLLEVAFGDKKEISCKFVD
jgi:hypothetical protein